MKPKPKPHITDSEFEQMLDFESRIIDASMRQATRLRIGESISNTSDHGSFFGYINVLPADTVWPMHDDEPMLPLLQINLSQSPHRQSQLAGIEYLLVFCGIESSLDMATGLLSELFEICQKPNHKEKVKAFYERNAEKIKISYSPDADHIRVLTVDTGAGMTCVTSQDRHSILKPHRIDFELIQDTVDGTGFHYEAYLAPQEAVHAEELLRKRDHTDEQFNEYLSLFKNVNGSKLGGWPSCIQDYVDFDGEADFVLQIASDEQIGLMLLDAGTIYIGYNAQSDRWVSEWACY